ncbi:MAG: glycosyltransferase family 2 protein, partial [Planctomycetaceae bacterium]|nr:glycosyltransferase family 2 protein [Planctomycetaceae bacterium]
MRQVKNLERQRKKVNLPEGWPVHQIFLLDTLKHQRNWSKQEGYRPTIQLLLPVQSASKAGLQTTVKSVLSQSYEHWQLCIICNREVHNQLSAVLTSLEHKDSRISVLVTGDAEPFHSLNQAIKDNDDVDYVGVIREGDTLSKEGLFQVADHITRAPETDVLYTDEVHVNAAGNQVESVLLKPDWSPEMLLGYNYLGSLSVVRKSILSEVGGFQPKYKAAQEWDLNLRLAERDCKIRRIPRCCYLRHNKMAPVPQGTATPESAESYRNVLSDYVKRQNLPAKVETNKNGTLRLRWQLSDCPLVSIIIPSKNSPKLIKQIVHDLVQNTSYPNKEIVIVDNQSDDPEVLRFYEQQRAMGNVKVTQFDETFNYSAACNKGASVAEGQIYLFLNNDMEVCSSDWLDEMVGWAVQDDIGIVGTKLVYPNGIMQHCGVVIGPPPLAGLIYHKVPEAEWGIFGTLDSYRNYLSVIGACQMIRRDVFEELNGYDEEYLIASSDTAFCLRASKAGYRTVYTPFAELIHHEGLTRGKTNPVQDIERLARDIREMGISEDSYHHPLLSPNHPEPTVRSAIEPSSAEFLHHDLNKYDPSEESFLPLDWSDYASFQASIAAFGAPLSIPLYSPPMISSDTTEAAKFIIHVLLRRDEIRAQFPFALSEGKDGGYCKWLCEEGLKQYHIPKKAKAAEQIQEAFEQNPAANIRQLYLSFRPDLRA